MNKDFLGVSTQQLHNALQNTIRVFDEYRMNKKMHDAQTFRIYSTEDGGLFYLVKYFDVEDGVQIRVTCGKLFGKITEVAAVNFITTFLSRLEQVFNGHIVLTADVANRDIYKSVDGLSAVGIILRLAIAIITVIMGLLVLMR